MKPDIFAEHMKLAAEATDRIQSGHWADWRHVARGLADGRQLALREAYTNQPVGSAYNKRFGAWMDEQKWPRKYDKPTRNHLLWVADHLEEIEAWRETLATNQRMRLNHPTAVKRRFDAARREKIAKEKGEVVQSPQAQMKAALVEAQEAADKWRRRAEEGGSLFDLRRDSPEDIARIMAETCTPTRLGKIGAAIMAEVRRQKAAHAG